MKRIFALALAVCLLLCGCGGEMPNVVTEPSTTQPPATEPTTAEPTEPSTEATEPPTEPTTQPPADPVPAYVHPITGEPLEEPCLNRPYAVVMDNDEKDSTPHWGCSHADMIWELPHEGGTTRMVGVFSDVSDVDKLGPNRSVRPYILSIARSFNAILVHAGGSPQGYELLSQTRWNNLDGVQGPNADDYYHRDKDRQNSGVASWHTMYTTGQEVLEYTRERGYDNTFDEQADYGFTFTSDATPGGEDADTVTIRFQKSGKKTVLHYDANAGDYTMEQFGKAYADGNDGTVPHFQNILVLKTSVGTIDDYGRLRVDLVGSGDGYFACGGEMVSIRWSRDSESSPYCFTLEDGTLLTLGIGKTYAAVIYKNGTVTPE